MLPASICCATSTAAHNKTEVRSDSGKLILQCVIYMVIVTHAMCLATVNDDQ